MRPTKKTKLGRELLLLCVGCVLPVSAQAADPAAHGAEATPKKSLVTEGLRDSKESAEDSAEKAKAALQAARAAVEAAKASGEGDKHDAAAAKTALEAVKAERAAAGKPERAVAPKAETKGDKAESKTEHAEQPKVGGGEKLKADQAKAEPAPPKAEGASHAAPVAEAAPGKPAHAEGSAVVAQPEGAPAIEGAVVEAPKKKSRFGSGSDLFGEEGTKKKGKKREAPVPLTPEQAKAVEIKAFCDKARAAIKRGEFEVAQGLLESLVAVDLPDSEKKVALQEVATIYEEKGDLTKPIAIYEKLCVVLESDGDIPAWLLKLGQLYRDAGAYQMAISRYYGVIQLGMKMGSSDFTRYQGLTRQAQREIANTYFMKGDFEQAQKFYNMAVRSDLPKEERAVAMFRSAHCTFMRNDMNGAVNSLERFLKDYSRHPSAAEARYMLASAYKALGRAQDAYDTVIELLRDAKGKAEADPKAWAFWQKKAGNEFANDYYQRGDVPNAVTIYQALAALETAPEWRWPVVYQMGLCFERLHLEPRAVECYKYIVDENSKPEFRWRKMPQSAGNLVKMAAWRVEQLAWENATSSQLRSTAGNEVPSAVPR